MLLLQQNLFSATSVILLFNHFVSLYVDSLNKLSKENKYIHSFIQKHWTLNYFRDQTWMAVIITIMLYDGESKLQNLSGLT